MIHLKTLKDLARGLRAREFSSRELVCHFLARIARYNPTLNAFITVTGELALEEAAKADASLARGEGGPLTGIPLAHKDIFCTLGIRTSCGSKMLDNFRAPYDATVVEKFKQVQMPLLGKLNMDEFAMGSSNETSFYGPVRNPWNINCVPGGSSGGSAAAVAAGLTPAATGTDTGGSIRQPAALCGITGLKPTYGRVSRWGMIAFASSLDQGGPLARSAEDCALLLAAMAGFDPKDSTSVDLPVPDYTAALGQSLAGKKIGLPEEFFAELDSGMAKVLEEAIAEYRKLKVEFVKVSLPNLRLSVPAYYIIAPSECSSNLARYDGVRYGYRCQDPKDLNDLYLRTRAEGFGAEVKRRILIGTYALSAGYYDAYYLKAQKIRRLIAEDFKRAFASVDLLLGPTTPTPAFGIGEKLDDPIAMYLSDIFTIAVNLAGLPAISVPTGFLDGKPVGMQLIGNYFDEAGLLNAAHQYQQVTDWHLKFPPEFA
jgi:aspartyl-tRNA(Asn)/glutamyl-tRNA(Gln) amidotransferase subunit A